MYRYMYHLYGWLPHKGKLLLEKILFSIISITSVLDKNQFQITLFYL